MSAMPPAAPAVACQVCGQEVPAGEYCGHCGAHLPGGSRARHDAFAADPSEHVLALNPISTLLPHLPRRHSAPFRVALVVVVVVLVVLGLLRLTGPAVAAAAFAVPFLYLLYLFETEVYEDDPALVVTLTFGLGLLLGIPFALGTGPLVAQASLARALGVESAGRVGLVAVLFPLIAQALMLVGALVIFVMRRFDEALDGFTFGAAGALGFTLTSTFVELLPALRAGPVADTPIIPTMLEVLQRGLLIPFIHASTTGLIAGALWLARGRRRPDAPHGWIASIPAAVLAAALVFVGLAFVDVYTRNLGLAVAIYAAVALALLLWVRLALHAMLLAEAVEARVGPAMVCPHCGRLVPRMAFCPHCGIATRATPNFGANRAARAVR